MGTSLSFSNSINASIIFIVQNLSCKRGCGNGCKTTIMVNVDGLWLLWPIFQLRYAKKTFTIWLLLGDMDDILHYVCHAFMLMVHDEEY